MESNEKNFKMTDEKPMKKSGLIAKKDFLIVQNDIRIEIKKGESIENVPKMFWDNLKTEQVI